MKVQFTETVLRDANQSLIATRLPFNKFQPILEKLDQAGYYSLECWGGATFDSCLRYLDEDPWERLRKIKAACPNTKLQMLLRGRIFWDTSTIPMMWSVCLSRSPSRTAWILSVSSTPSMTSVTSRSPWTKP